MSDLPRRDWQTASGIFILALLVRLLFLFTSPDRTWPHSIFYEGDAPTWAEWAHALDEGKPFELDLPLRSPAVAYLLHWIHPGILQGPFTPHKALWCVFTSLACSLIYLACAMSLNRRVGLLAAGMYTFSFGSYVLSTTLNNEAPYTLALMASVVLTLRVIRKPSMFTAVALAAVSGLAMLIRTEHVLLVGFLLAYVAWRYTRQPASGGLPIPAQRKIGVLATVLVGSILICLPWSIHGSLATRRFNTIPSTPVSRFQNSAAWTPQARAFVESMPAFAQDGTVQSVDYIGQHEGFTKIDRQDVLDILSQQFGYVHEPLSSWVFLSLKGPLDFAMANHPNADGGFSKIALLGPGETEEPKSIAFARPHHLKLVNHGYAIGWDFITSDFGGWVNRVRSKLAYFADGIALGFSAMNFPPGWEGERRSVDMFTTSGNQHSLTNFLWRVTIILLLAGGVLVALRRRCASIWLLIVIYKLIATILFYGYARQSVSIAPAFYVLMALSIDQMLLFPAVAKRMSGRVSVIFAAVLIAGLLVADITRAIHRPHLTISGNPVSMPKWGAEAFESVGPLEFRISPSDDAHD